MKVTTGTLVAIHFELFDTAGELVESTLDGDPVTFRCGDGDALPGLERALQGAEPGGELRVTLGPDEAFGVYQPGGLLNVPRDEFPAEVTLEPGEWISISVLRDESDESDDDGEDEEDELEACIVEVNDDEVVLDANHPLAGQEVTFVVRIVSVDAPTAER